MLKSTVPLPIYSSPQAGDYNPVINMYDSLIALVQDKKIVAISENGPIPDPDKLVAYHADWSWFCTWGGGFISDGSSNSLDHVKQVYNCDYVITSVEKHHNLFD